MPKAKSKNRGTNIHRVNSSGSGGTGNGMHKRMESAGDGRASVTSMQGSKTPAQREPVSRKRGKAPPTKALPATPGVTKNPKGGHAGQTVGRIG